MKTKTVQLPPQEARRSKDFVYSFRSSRSSAAIYNLLMHMEQWWTGFYDETITGQSNKPGDEFEFWAGNSAHYTKQRLIERVPNKTLVWEVTDCHLQFVTKHDEWVGTTIGFYIKDLGENREVTFRHCGLTPKFECYDSCSSAWTEYLDALQRKLKY